MVGGVLKITNDLWSDEFRLYALNIDAKSLSEKFELKGKKLKNIYFSVDWTDALMASSWFMEYINLETEPILDCCVVKYISSINCIHPLQKEYWYTDVFFWKNWGRQKLLS